MPSPTEPNYRMNGEHYVLFRGETPVGAPLLEVALAIDTEDGTLHKHGSPERVASWAQEARARLRERGGPVGEEWASKIVVATGRFPVEDINRCITTSGYAGTLYQRLMQGQLQIEGPAGKADQADRPVGTSREGPRC
jgi:hypothetical protein